jgi:PKD repeat protein
MRAKLLLLTLVATFAAYTLNGQISFVDGTDNLRYGTLRSGAPMAVVDMNNDGLDDIVCLEDRRYLYIEYQRPDTNIFEGVYYGDTGSPQWSICAADYDKNGYNDLFFGGQYNELYLYQANADGTDFEVDLITDPSIFLQGSNFVDINTDGKVDIFACHDDGLSVPFEGDGQGNFSPNFNLITAASTVPSDNSGNYGAVWIDYDNDKDLDLYISKCRLGVEDPTDGRRLNLLFQNDGSNNFTDVAAQANLLPFGQSWASDFGDIDNDGDLDCFIINHDIANSLYRNNGDGSFTDITAVNGIFSELSSSGLGMQAKFADFDNDGYLDLLYTSLGFMHALLHNNGDGTFTRLDDAFPYPDERIHSATVGDLNNDGFLDVYAGYGFGYNQVSSQHDRLFLNSPNDNHYFRVLLEGTSSNRNAIGARLELYGLWGKQIREIRSGESYGIMNSYVAHFGLGDAAAIDSLYIYWPSGNTDRIIDPPADTLMHITEGDFCLPLADFTYSSPGLAVQFTGIGDVGVDSWAWTFADGTLLDGQVVDYTFPQVGNYTVCLNTSGSCGDSQICKTVNVSCLNLEAFFDHDADGLDLSFEDISFGEPSSWLWNFGDGNVSTEQNPNHAYSQPGTYFVCLTIENECGNAGFCEFIPVSCGNVTTAFNKDINELIVNFTDFSSSGTTEWVWNFGDGNLSTEQNPTHTYAAPGSYQVCLSIDGVCGSGETCELISVSCSAPDASFLSFADELSVDFTDNSSFTPTDWAWDFGDGQTASEQNPNHTYDAPGDYVVCMIASNICGIDTLCRDISISCAPPEADFLAMGSGLAYSFGDASTNEASNWQWTINGILTDTTDAFDYIFAQPGNYEVCLQSSSICGTDSTCSTVTVSCLAPQAAYNYSNDELAYIFTDTSDNGPSDWQWWIDGNLLSLEDTLAYSFPAPGTYESCLISSNICGTDTLCQSIVVSCTAPVAGFTYQLDGLSISLADTSTNQPTSSQWFWGDNLIGEMPLLDYSFPATGDYEICLVSGSICGADTSCQLISLDCLPPMANFNAILDGLAGQFTDLSDNEPDSWQWSVDGLTVGNSSAFSYQFPINGTYELCLEVGNNCGQEEYCQTITVNCNAVFSAFNFTQDELTLSCDDASSDNAIEWRWDFGDGNMSSQQNPEHTYELPGTYLLCLGVKNTCGDSTQNCQSVEVNCSTPEAAFAYNSDLLMANFTDLSAGHPTSWEWAFGDGNTSSQQNPQHLYSSAGTYTACVTATSICGSTQICQDIVITCPTPQAGFEISSDELSIMLTDTSQNAPIQWQWDFGDGNSSNIPSPSHTYDMPGQYIVCLTTSSTCGMSQACKQVDVSCAAPVAGFSSSTQELSISLEDLTANTPTAWSWDFGDGNGSTLPNPQHTYSLPGQYTICLTASSICGTDNSCQDITVSCSPPEADFSITTDGLNISLTDNSNNEPAEWLWTFGDGNASSLQHPSHSYDSPGTYQVCLQSSSICGSTTNCQSVEVSCAAPVAGFDYSADELLLNFEDQSTGTTTEWLWEFGDGNSASDVNPTHNYATPGTYTVCLTTTSICGSTQDCQTISISCTAPLATYNYESNQLEITFSDLSTNTPSGWQWEFGDGNISNLQNPVHTYDEPGFYTICLTAESICGSSQFCQEIEVTCIAPQSNFLVDTEELVANFTDISEDNPTSWSWTFGDGQSSDLQNPQHTYAFPGNYLVCLTVSSVCGTTQRCELTEIGCTPPQAAFTYDADELDVAFIDNSTADAVAWLWDFGDGQGSTLASPSHSYATPGSYEVCLTSSNICGSTTSCQTIEIICQPPVAGFDVVINGLAISLTNLSSEDAISYLWLYGDGNDSNLPSPSHLYDSSGVYEVCLIASNICGTDTVCQEVMLSTSNNDSPAPQEHNLQLYPNPATQHCNLYWDIQSNKPYNWQITNTIGQVVYSGYSNIGMQASIDVEHLAQGLYVIRVSNGDKQQSKVLIISR